jgi:hypothetical protein
MPPVKVFDKARRRLSEANLPKVGSELIKSCIILGEENANGIAENAGVPEVSSIRSAALSLFPSGKREIELKVPGWGPDKPHGSTGQSLKRPAGPDPAELCNSKLQTEGLKARLLGCGEWPPSDFKRLRGTLSSLLTLSLPEPGSDERLVPLEMPLAELPSGTKRSSKSAGNAREHLESDLVSNFSAMPAAADVRPPFLLLGFAPPSDGLLDMASIDACSANRGCVEERIDIIA